MKTEDKRRKQIDSLQALRALAIVSVMLSHTQLRYVSGAGAWGVTVFFVLSGFVMIYSYYETGRMKERSLFRNFLFAWGRIKNIYLLHLLTTLATAVFFFIGNDKEDMIKVGVRLLLNALLLQEWVPLAGRSINGVAWYLSVAAFCYFIFPWVLHVMENKKYSRTIAKTMILVWALLQIVIGFIVSRCPIPTDSMGGWLDQDLTLWVGYHCPLTRAMDFLIGCNAAYLFVTRDKAKTRASGKELLWSIVTLAAILMENAIFIKMKWAALECAVPVVAHPERWWTYSALFRLSSASIVYLMATEAGLLSKWFTNRVTRYIGNISQHLFLIHAVVYLYLSKLVENVLGAQIYTNYMGWIRLTVGVLLSFIATKIWMLLIHKDVKF